MRILSLSLLVCWSLSHFAHAQAPSLGYCFPPAVQRGKTTDVVLGGYDLTPDMQFFVHHPEVQLQASGDLGPFLVPPRPYWEGPRVFMNALPIPREQPARLTVSATMPTGTVRWQAANANGATGTACLYVSDIREIVEQRLRAEAIDLGTLPVGLSGRLSRLTEKDVYTLTPQTTGQVQLDCWARRLGSDINVAVQVTGPAGKTLVNEVDTEGQDVAVGFDAQAGQQYTIHVHDADFRGAAQFVYRLVVSRPAVKPARPAGKTLLKAGAAHVLQPVAMVAGKQYRIRVLGQAIGSDLDLQLALVDAEGKVVAENDDATATTLDPELLHQAKEGVAVKARISGFPITDVDPDRRYQLDVAEVTRGFQLTVPQTIVAASAGKGSLNVTLQAAGGFKEEVSLQVAGLPPGVTVEGEPKIAAGKNKGAISLLVAKDAKVQAGLIQVSGRSAGNEEQGLKPLEAIATAPLAGNLAAGQPLPEVTSDVLLVITLKAPFKLELIDRNRQRVVHCGTTYPAPFLLKRDEGYQGLVRLVMAAKQGRHRMGITGPILEVPVDQVEVFYPCFMPEWLSTDRTTRMVVYGYGEMADPTGVMRHVGLAADARVTMILEGALLKVRHEIEEMRCQPGSPFEVPVEIVRSSLLATEVQVDLELPKAWRAWISCDPVRLAPGQTLAILKVATTSKFPLRGTVPITIRATAMQEGRWLVKSIVDVDVEFK
jgi:hypothetical protein